MEFGEKRLGLTEADLAADKINRAINETVWNSNASLWPDSSITALLIV